MKLSVYLSLFVMLVLLFSCSENRDARALFERVDSLMDEDPKLVLMMLDSASDASIDYPRRQKMRYELLRAKAMNKAYVDFTTDSIMKEVVEYYDNHGTANEKVEAHYLLGCVYRDLHESPAALSCYHDALECADTLSGDFDNKLLMRVHAQMADLFDNQIMPYQELEELYLYEHYALAASDTFSYIIGKELESRAYNLMNDKDMEVKALLEANRLFKSKGYKADAAQAIVSIIPVYIERGDTANAASVIRYFENESGLIDENGDVSDNFWHYYNSKGLYFESINNLDSAEFFYRKLCKRGFNYDAYKGLLSIFSKKEMADSVFLYSSLKENAFDLQYTNLHTQAMFNANGMYNYARNQRIALEKEKEALNYSNNILYICVISGVIMLLSLYLFIKYKRNKKKEYNLLVSRYHTNREEYHKAVDDYRQMEENFEDYKKNKAEEINRLQGELTNFYSENAKENKEIVMQEIRESREFENIMKKAKVVPYNNYINVDNSEWEELFVLFKKELPSFYTFIITNYILSEQEKKVSIFTVLKVDTKTMALLLNTTSASISNTKKNISKKLFSTESARSLYSDLIQKI